MYEEPEPESEPEPDSYLQEHLLKGYEMNNLIQFYVFFR